MLGAHRPQLGRGLHDDLRKIARLAPNNPPNVGACQQQQVRDEAAHTLGRAQSRACGIGLFAVQGLGQQLEVGKHARQRRAQLVRGVGHELALARKCGFGLGMGGVELVQHAAKRACKLGDLVFGKWLGHAAAWVARTRDLLGRPRQLGDRRHRASRDHHSGQQRKTCAGEHAKQEQQLDARDGAFNVGETPTVLDNDVPADRGVKRNELRVDAVAVGVGFIGPPEFGCTGTRRKYSAADAENTNRRVLGACELIEIRRVGDVQREAFGLVAGDAHPQEAGEVGRRSCHFTVEIGADTVNRERADDQRERAQDRERQQCRDTGQARTNRQTIERDRYALHEFAQRL